MTGNGGERSEQPLYPSSRAFVVQLKRDAEGESLTGRVEHVASGRSRRFGSHEDLVAFMHEVLEDSGSGVAQGRPGEAAAAVARHRRRVDSRGALE